MFLNVAALIMPIFVLGAFYFFLANRILQERNRLPLNVFNLESFSGDFSAMDAEYAAPPYSAAREWLSFFSRYCILLLPIFFTALAWEIYRLDLIGSAKVIAGYIHGELVFPEGTRSNIWLPACITIGASLLRLPKLKSSITYPFLASHVMLAAICCLSDALGINDSLNSKLFTSSALNGVVWTIFLSSAIWAISYPHPIKAIFPTLAAMAFSLASAFAAFIFVEIYSAFSGPTLTAFTVYVAFGYGVFGLHLWSLTCNRVSQAF